MHYYKRVSDGEIVSVEAKSIDVASPNFTKATKAEYDNYIASLPVIEPEPEPPHSTHLSTIEAIDPSMAKPVRIKRVWEAKYYFYDCLVTESVKDQYVAGNVKVGDYVIVHFDDIGEQIVTAKVYKSW